MEHNTNLLSLAAMSGREGVVRVLLRRGDVNLDRRVRKGRTALWLAAGNGCERVKMLLGPGDVTPNKPDKNGQTPFDCPAARGHAGMIALLPYSL